jgi:hypothetical protein
VRVSYRSLDALWDDYLVNTRDGMTGECFKKLELFLKENPTALYESTCREIRRIMQETCGPYNDMVDQQNNEINLLKDQRDSLEGIKAKFQEQGEVSSEDARTVLRALNLPDGGFTGKIKRRAIEAIKKGDLESKISDLYDAILDKREPNTDTGTDLNRVGYSNFVCRHYASLAHAMLLKAGIESQVVQGAMCPQGALPK